MVHPIMLWGFCFHTQNKQVFNTPWAAAWLTNRYTDESQPQFDGVSLEKRREIKYGNNVAILFRAMIHLRKFWGHDCFWVAVARGFNTNATIARATANILTDARLLQRGKPSRDTSDTAQDADVWIEFLDENRDQHPLSRVPSDHEAIRTAETFFRSQEKKLVNAAHVPISSYQGRGAPSGPSSNHYHSSRGAPDDDDTFKGRYRLSPQRLSPTGPPVKREHPGDAPRFPRKRSPSPGRGERSPKQRRINSQFDSRETSGVIHPTRDAASDPSAQAPPKGPAALQSGHEESHKSADATDQTAAIKNGENGTAVSKDVPGPDKAGLVNGTAENTLAQKPSAAAQLRGRLSEDIVSLRKEMGTATTAISTMMQSMHEIVDNLAAMNGQLASLNAAREEQEHQEEQGPPSLKPFMDAIKSLKAEMSGVREVLRLDKVEAETLRNEIRQQQQNYQKDLEGLKKHQSQQLEELKKEIQRLHREHLALQNQQLKAHQEEMHSLRSEMENGLSGHSNTTAASPAQQFSAADVADLKTLVKERFDKLANDIAGVQPNSPITAAGISRQPTPRTLTEAMAAAEKDLKRHLSMVQGFYHRLDSSHGTNRAITERTADFILALQNSVATAQLSQQAS